MLNKAANTNRTKVIPLEESHFEALYSWITDAENNMLWSNVREFPKKENYYQYLKFKIEQDFLSQYAIIGANSKDLLGTIFIHDQSMDDGYAFITIYLIPTARKKYYGVEALFIVLNYLFSNFPLRKLYFDAFSYNKTSINLLKKVGFKLEGKFIEHRKMHSGYADLLRYACFKDDWNNFKKGKDNLICTDE
ncbi:MAG: GNAT family N-acetyltransferase [Flavobacteriales bacterium]